jgi:uncharacterized protein DUF4258
VQLNYSIHALDRMRPSTADNPDGRNISPAEVEATLAQPEIRYEDNARGSVTYIGHVAGRRIKVVVEEKASETVVITVAD